jgi:hypothetical protein
MSALSLVPVSEFSFGNLPVAANPPMSYDVTLGTPTVQLITPPFTNLPCHIDEINGAGPSYVWNQNLGAWKTI